MGVHLVVYLGVAAIVIVIPGPDTAVLTKNVLIHGRRAGMGTSLGVCLGLSLWTLAAAFGVASAVRASAVPFTVLKLAGALYLIWLVAYTLIGDRAAEALMRPRVRAAMDRLTGVVLIALGLRRATERC